MVVYFEGLNFFPIFNFYEVVKQDSDKKTSGIGEHNIEKKGLISNKHYFEVLL